MENNGEKQAWLEVSLSQGLAEGAALSLRAGGMNLLLIRRQGRIYALENRCPHMDCPLARGRLEGFILTCPCHDWRFDIRSGEMPEAKELKVKTCPAKEEGGKVLVSFGDLS
jgi:nitrite reductase/ring-hydroxylating ferredoxin subunit